MTPDTDPRRPDGRLEEAAAGDSAASLSRSNRRVAISVLAGVALMTGAAYASVPLYELFCQVTGYGGTTQRADAPTGTVIDRKITVRFDGNVNSDLPWEFKPTQRTITLRMGRECPGRLCRDQSRRRRQCRHLGVQRHALRGRLLLQQDRVLLLYRAAA